MNNGYATININSNIVGIKFGLPANEEFSIATEKKRDLYYRKVKIKDEDTGEEKEVESLTHFGYAKLFHCGYKNNCMLKEVEPELTLEDFSDWVDESIADKERMSEIVRVLTVFNESRYVKMLVELGKTNGEETEETKKKILKSGSKKLKAGS